MRSSFLRLWATLASPLCAGLLIYPPRWRAGGQRGWLLSVDRIDYQRVEIELLAVCFVTLFIALLVVSVPWGRLCAIVRRVHVPLIIWAWAAALSAAVPLVGLLVRWHENAFSNSSFGSGGAPTAAQRGVPIKVSPEDFLSGPVSSDPTSLSSDAAKAGSAENSQPFSVPTGTWAIDLPDSRGLGVLEIENGTPLDSLVKLVSTDLPREAFWAVFIQAHDHYTVNEIPPGSYLLRFALGRNWDVTEQRFMESPSFYQAGGELTFTEESPTISSEGQYTHIHITLHDVVGGNLPRVGISAAEFNEGSK